jgi:hypothetical protein
MAAALAATLLAGCGSDSPTASEPTPVLDQEMALSLSSGSVSSSTRAVLWSALWSTLRFIHPAHAVRAGYLDTHECVAVPALGGMGVHFVNPELIDDEFDPRRPEALVYDPGPRGRLQLVALEYIVLDVGQEAPTFGGQPFDVGGTPDPRPHWSLHVWLYKHNPSGLFAPFNPRVSCPEE